MSTAAAVLSVLLAALLIFAAARKLSHREEVVAAYARVGVREEQLDSLAAILLAGAAGLLGGLLWAPLGIAAGLGVAVYFLLAVAAHLRARDHTALPNPLAIEALALTVVALGIAGA